MGKKILKPPTNGGVLSNGYMMKFHKNGTLASMIAVDSNDYMHRYTTFAADFYNTVERAINGQPTNIRAGAIAARDEISKLGLIPNFRENMSQTCEKLLKEHPARSTNWRNGVMMVHDIALAIWDNKPLV